MKKKNHLLFIVTTALVAGPLLAEAQGYDYESIDYPGAGLIQVFGVNNRGNAVGNAFVDPDAFPFVYDTRNGTITNIAPIGDYDSTAILGISESGVVVGSVSNNSTGVVSGLIVDKNGNATVFDHPDAVSETRARAINNRGLVTGYRDSDDPFGRIGFIYDPKTGTFTDIVPSRFTIAQGINSRGEVVGSAFFIPDDDPCGTGSQVSSVRYGWLRTTDGNVTYFSVNGERTSARGISDSGTIVGFSTSVDQVNNRFVTKGFVTELDGTQCQQITIAEEDLLQFPGAVETFLQGITNSGGVIVGIHLDEFDVFGGFVARPR